MSAGMRMTSEEARQIAEELTALLRSRTILPLDTSPRWHRVGLQHPPPSSVVVQRAARRRLVEGISEGAGLYIFRGSRDGRVLYVGESEGVRGRLRHHHREICRPNAATGKESLYRFLWEHPEPLHVLWTEVEGTALRLALEGALKVATGEAWSRWIAIESNRGPNRDAPTVTGGR